MLKKLGISLLLVASSLFAQTSDRLVESIVITNLGTQAALAQEAALSHIELKAGEPFSQIALDRSVKALYATGFFEDITAIPQNTPNGRVQVEFKLTPKLKLRTINFEGNRHVKDKRIERKLDLAANDRLDAQKIAANARQIEEYYETKGYPYAKVITRTTKIEEAGLADLTFVIDEGMKAQIEKISFVGNHSVDTETLEDAIKTHDRSWMSWLTGSGKIEEDRLEVDVEILTNLYRNRGYLEAVIDSPQTKELDEGVELVYSIDEGARYQVGSIKMEGNTIFNTELLSQQITLAPGQAVSPNAITASATNIANVYRDQGYLETNVRTQMLPSTQPQTIDLHFSIIEAPQVRVGSIDVEGNTLTKSVVVARELNLAPGDVFSAKRMDVSQQRLQNTGYFSSVNLTNEPTSNDSVQDLRVTLDEGKTGNILFGAGVSSLDNATIFGEFTQSNFDLFNPSNFFRGDGQKFRLYMSLSQESSEASLNWEEPWLFEQRLALGTNLYRTETDYVSSKFNERRTGGEIYLRKRLFELVNGRIGYRRENVNIFEVSDDASTAIKAEAGKRGVSKLELSLTRDTRDQVLFPTKGNRVELNFEYAGGALGSETDYWSVEARGAKYIKTTDAFAPQTLILLGRVGTMDSFDGNEVPLFDRFFLGGPNSLRGFDYRAVGPMDNTDEPLGGKSYAFGSVEYSFQLAEPFHLATFYDWGFVNSDSGDFSASEYNDNWGFGARIMVMGAPLRLDMAFPISSTTQNDDGGQFWFSFGTRF